MNGNQHSELSAKIWEMANLLRGLYRPPQYRLVMLPLIVLRRFDCVLEPTKDVVFREYERLRKLKTPEKAMVKLLSKVADPKRNQPLYNTSNYNFVKLLSDQEHIKQNLVAYIEGFSKNVYEIFERFQFHTQIEKLDESNRLYVVIKAVATINLHPNIVDNRQMGLSV